MRAARWAVTGSAARVIGLVAVVAMAQLAGLPMAPRAAAVGCAFQQVTSSPSASQFTDGAGLQALLDSRCTGAGDSVTVDFLPGTLTLSSELVFTGGRSLTLTGHGTTLSGGGSTRLLRVQASQVTLTDLVLTNGSADNGGAIMQADTKLNLVRTTITNNRATAGGGNGRGGAIYSWQESGFPLLFITDSVMWNNSATGNGGAIYTADSGVVAKIDRSRVLGNSAGQSGGGIYARGGIEVVDSSISENSAAQDGGGLVAVTGGVVRGSTLAANGAANNGGAAWESGTLHVFNSTVTGNLGAVSGGAFYLQSANNQLTLTSTTVSGNSTQTSPGLAFGDSGVDLIARGSAVADTCALPILSASDSALDTSCASGGSNIYPANFGLAPLGNNGGPTLTLMPTANSPLVAAIADGSGLPATDQRGVTRSAPYWIGAVQDGAARTPTFDTPVATADGFTVNVTNYDPAWAWTPSTSAGSATAGTASGTTLPLVVTGLQPTGGATVTLRTTRAHYADGSATVSGAALQGAARTPTFDTPVATSDGFTVNVTNYDPAWAWTPSASAGSATAGTASGTTLPLVVTGLAPTSPATVTVRTTRTNYADGSATVSAAALLGAARTPTFDTPVPIVGGFTLQVTNYDPTWNWDVSSSAGTLTRGTPNGTNLPLTVSGLAPAQLAAVTATASRTGYATGQAQVIGSPDPLGPNQPNAQAAASGDSAVMLGGSPVPGGLVLDPLTGAATLSGPGWAISFTGHNSAGQLVLPTTGSTSMALAGGGTVTITGSGLAGNTPVQVWLFSDPARAATTMTNTAGDFSATIAVPADLGVHVVQVNGATTGGQVRSASLKVTVTGQIKAKARATKSRSKLTVTVTPSCKDQYRFRVQQRVISTAPAGSDEPNTITTYRWLPKTYRTTGSRPASRTIDLPRGTYRAFVLGSCGQAGAVTGFAKLTR